MNRLAFVKVSLFTLFLVISSFSGISLSANADTTVEVNIKNRLPKNSYSFTLLANIPSKTKRRESENNSESENTAIFQELHTNEEPSFLQCNTELERVKQVTNELHSKLDDIRIVLKKLTFKQNMQLTNKQPETFECKKEDGIMKILYREIYQFINGNEPTNALFATNLGLQLEPSNLRLLAIKFQLENADTGDLNSIKIFIQNFGYF